MNTNNRPIVPTSALLQRLGIWLVMGGSLTVLGAAPALNAPGYADSPPLWTAILLWGGSIAGLGGIASFAAGRMARLWE